MEIQTPADGASIEEVRSFFKNDRFATEAGHCVITEARRGYSVCELEVEPVHRNALGAVMGGAIFTLADFAAAVASNVGEPPTVSIAASVEFMSGCKGNKLIATCVADKSGRKVGFYEVMVRDELGTNLAKIDFTTFR